MQLKTFNEINLTRVLKVINLKIPAKKAQLGPPVGPALSQVKVKVKIFCDMFNTATKHLPEGFPLSVKIIVFKNQTFNFYIKTPSSSFLVKNYMKHKGIKSISLLDVYKFAKIKHLDFPFLSLKNVYKNLLNFTKLYNIKIKN